MTQAPQVSILIVAYNSAAIIADCLAAIPAACTEHAYEILLIDNGDGSTEALVARQFPEVRIVQSRGNVGFAAGNNYLAAEAQGSNLLLLNPDLILKPRALDHLLEATRTYPEAAAWGGVTVDRDDRPDLGNSVHIPSLGEMASRALGRSSVAMTGRESFEQDEQVPVMSGSFIMFSRKAWDEVGGLDERYFLYCEEVDLFYRLAQRGGRFWRIAAARGFHDIGHGEVLGSKRMLYRAAGTMQFTRLHWSKPAQWLAFILLWVGAWQRVVAGSLIERWKPRIGIVGRSHRDIALKPRYWCYGYDPARGLLVRLNSSFG